MTPGAPADPPTPAPDSLASPTRTGHRLRSRSAPWPSARSARRRCSSCAPAFTWAPRAARSTASTASALAWGRLRGEGSAAIGTAAPLPVEASLALTQDGALANAAVVGARRADGRSSRSCACRPRCAPSRPAPPVRRRCRRRHSISPRRLRSLERWPLGDLQANAKGLDLSAFHRDAPATAISGEAIAKTHAADQPGDVNATLDNATPGLWNDGKLPLRRLTLALRARPDDPSTLELRALAAELGTAKQPAGRIAGHGRWSREGWSLDATLAALQPDRLDARAPAMRLDGPLTLTGSLPTAAAQRIAARAELAGVVRDRGADRPVKAARRAVATRERRRPARTAQRRGQRRRHAPASSAARRVARPTPPSSCRAAPRWPSSTLRCGGAAARIRPGGAARTSSTPRAEFDLSLPRNIGAGSALVRSRR